jgi:hypothetical protein
MGNFLVSNFSLDVVTDSPKIGFRPRVSGV